MQTGIEISQIQIEEVETVPASRLAGLRSLVGCSLEEAETFVPYARYEPEGEGECERLNPKHCNPEDYKDGDRCNCIDPGIVRIFVSIRSKQLNGEMKGYVWDKKTFVGFFTILELPEAAIQLVWEKMETKRV